MILKSNDCGAFLALLSSMIIFGTVGIFSKYIPLPSSLIALARAVVGLVFLAIVMLIKRQPPNFSAIKNNLLKLTVSGALLGINWLLFFEACKRTSVASATLSYYLAPIILIILAAVFFRERIGIKKGICIATALFGMVLVSGVVTNSEGVRIDGIVFGTVAAFLYAVIVLLNKSLGDISPVDKTAFQFAVSAIVLAPYILIAENLSEISFGGLSVPFLIIIGVLHTGIAYALYFGSCPKLPASTLAIVSYADPIVAIIVSSFLGEGLDTAGIIGAVLIIGASAVSEINFKGKVKDSENR
ncbi:MAG: EamA family transporter [Clostridia bacterium]|nr:EamA family transporter [Clostridia bacterium]